MLSEHFRERSSRCFYFEQNKLAGPRRYEKRLSRYSASGAFPWTYLNFGSSQQQLWTVLCFRVKCFSLLGTQFLVTLHCYVVRLTTESKYGECGYRCDSTSYGPFLGD